MKWVGLWRYYIEHYTLDFMQSVTAWRYSKKYIRWITCRWSLPGDNEENMLDFMRWVRHAGFHAVGPLPAKLNKTVHTGTCSLNVVRFLSSFVANNTCRSCLGGGRASWHVRGSDCKTQLTVQLNTYSSLKAQTEPN